MAVLTGQARLQKFGASATGSIAPVVLVGPVLIADIQAGFGNGNTPYIVSFGAAVALGGSSSVFQLQVSNDGTTWVEIERIEIPNSGVINITYERPIPICGAGQQFRIIGSQSTIARMSTTLFGITTNSDITDI